jgi:type I restriction enzyme R subunit
MDESKRMQSMNFEFLRPENETLANLAGLAEAVLFIDPGSALTRVRSFAEELTKAIYKEERLDFTWVTLE